jgi:hypothetical protein
MKKSGLESPTPIPQTQSAFHPHNNQTLSFVAGVCVSAIQIVRPLESIAETDSITPTAPRLAPIRAESGYVPARCGPEFLQLRGLIAGFIAEVQFSLDGLDLVLLRKRLPMINVCGHLIASPR